MKVEHEIVDEKKKSFVSHENPQDSDGMFR